MHGFYIQLILTDSINEDVHEGEDLLRDSLVIDLRSNTLGFRSNILMIASGIGFCSVKR